VTRVGELQPGDVFAGFRVVRKLSEGGMGAVYVVLHEATGRQRALKLMHPEMIGNADLRDKFIQEARIGARVESEHVVDVVDAGVDAENGIPWLLMELLQGEDLGTLLARRGSLELSEVSAIFEQLCHAIGAAHAAGIVHRDLKPDNIFLAATRQAGHAFTIKVLDFGIAKLVEEARTSNTGTLGTPFWMAPEQTDRHAQITPATDVWALGLIAYRLLTGKLFWRGAEGPSLSLPIFLREVVIDEIPLASVRAAEQGAAGVLPPGFDAWFARCVARSRESRFANAAAVYTGLAALEGGTSSANTALALPVASVVVRTDPAVITGAEATALAAAHTVHETVDREAGREDESPMVVPQRGLGRIWAIGAVIAVLGAGGAVLYARSPSPAGKSRNAPAHEAPPVAENRCPKSMVSIAKGSFAMGSEDGESDEKPVHTVAVDAFCLDLTEVLVSEYADCVAATVCSPAATAASWPQITPEDSRLWSGSCNAGRPEKAEHPINCVSWDDAAVYCKWASKRLPTEAEWEFAARGNEGRRYPWGNTTPSKDHLNACGEECARGQLLGNRDYVALFRGNDGWETTSPARSFGPGKTPEGVYDLAGNVLEWTASPYCKYTEPMCQSPWRVARGGAWNSDVREGVRAARRTKNAPSARSPDLGFRCAR